MSEPPTEEWQRVSHEAAVYAYGVSQGYQQANAPIPASEVYSLLCRAWLAGFRFQHDRPGHCRGAAVMPSDAVARLAKWRTCEGCECEALTQPWGPEGEWLCESCLEALTFPEDFRAGFYLAMATMAFLGLVALGLWWLLG